MVFANEEGAGLHCGPFFPWGFATYVALITPDGLLDKRAGIDSGAQSGAPSQLNSTQLNPIQPNPIQSNPSERYLASKILFSAWSNHPDFSENGEGRALPIQGEQSFTELVKRFSGDMTPVSTLSLLEQSGNVLRVGDELFLIKKHYLPVQTPTQQLALFGTDVNELMQTIIHNLSSKHQERWFQRKVSNAQVSVDALAAFKQYAAEKSMALLEDYDEWLSKHEISNQAQRESDPQGEAAAYVTVGIYYLETPKQESES